MEKRIIIAGSGGQGVLFAGKLLAYAAMLEGREVTWFPSYGARCGAARELHRHHIGQHDRLPGHQESRYAGGHERCFVPALRGETVSGGVLVYDPSQVHASTHRDDIRVIATPACDISAALNCSASANMALLGAFIAASRIVDVQSALRSVAELIPARRRDLLASNQEILMRGTTACRQPRRR